MAIKHYPEVITVGPAEHDPDGPDVQVHEVGDEVYVTFSDEYTQEQGWKEGDEVIWELDDVNGNVRISNPQADMRRTLRKKVDALLNGGPEL